MEENGETIGGARRQGKRRDATTRVSVEEKGRARKSGGGQKAGGERRKEREGTTWCTRARVKGREVRITGEGGRQRRRSRWKKGRKREDKRMRGQTGLQAVGRR